MSERSEARTRALASLVSLYKGEWDPWLGEEPEAWETHKEEIAHQVRWNLERVIPNEEVDFYVTHSLYGESFEEWLAGWLRSGIDLAARDRDEQGDDHTCNCRDNNRLPMTLLLCIAVSALTTILTKCVIALIG